MITLCHIAKTGEVSTMKKPNKDTLIEIIGAIILLALIGGIISCNTVGSCAPNKGSLPESNWANSN